MTVKGPEAIDPAPAGPERSGGRPETAILLRDAKAAQPPAENSWGRSLREGDRDAVVLRSHRTHRGLRGRPAARRGQEPDPGSLLIGGVRGHADGHRTAAMSPPSLVVLPGRHRRPPLVPGCSDRIPGPPRSRPPSCGRSPASARPVSAHAAHSGTAPHHPALWLSVRRLPRLVSARVGRCPPRHAPRPPGRVFWPDPIG